jgi:hypothetical protein
MCSGRSRFWEHDRMRTGLKLGVAEADDTTTASLRLMLSYVEAECLRIGAADAAKHAALAAALMPGLEAQAAADVSRSARRLRNKSLH